MAFVPHRGFSFLKLSLDSCDPRIVSVSQDSPSTSEHSVALPLRKRALLDACLLHF